MEETGRPLVVDKFVAHDSRVGFESLNHGSAAELNFRFGVAMGWKADNMGSL